MISNFSAGLVGHIRDESSCITDGGRSPIKGRESCVPHACKGGPVADMIRCQYKYLARIFGRYIK